MVKWNNMETQYDKITKLYEDGGWHCQLEFWKFSRSPHKRRGEYALKHGKEFAERKCKHGVRATKDFLLQEKTIQVPIVGKVENETVTYSQSLQETKLF